MAQQRNSAPQRARELVNYLSNYDHKDEANFKFDELLIASQVEALLQVGEGWCAKDRLGQARIPFVKLGRSVRYRPRDVFAYINKSLRRSTSDPGSGPPEPATNPGPPFIEPEADDGIEQLAAGGELSLPSDIRPSETSKLCEPAPRQEPDEHCSKKRKPHARLHREAR